MTKLTSSTAPAHAHEVDVSALEAAIKALDDRVTLLEEGSTDPTPPDPTWDRIIPAGSYGDFTFSTPNEKVLFDPNAVVKGRVILSAPNLVIEGLHTTSESVRETAVLIQKGSSGTLRKFLIEHVGTPSNGKGYSSISANDGGAGNGWAGPWTIEDGTIDQRTYGHYGIEVWGTKNLTVRRNRFIGKGGNNGAENGFMSTPRCDDMVVQANTFDMTQGCYRVIEIVEQLRAQFIDNTILNLRGDVVPMNGGSTNRCAGHTIARNRVSCVSSGTRLFCYLAGDGHTIVDNRLNTGVTAFQGTATNTYKANNGPTYGPPW